MTYRNSQARESAARRKRGTFRMDEETQRTIFAGGGVLGALAISSCCVLPLALFGLGVTGAWIGNLAALHPYKPYLFAATTVFLGLGFYRVYRKPEAVAREASRQCGAPLAIRVTKSALWLSAALALAALAFPYYVPLLLDS